MLPQPPSPEGFKKRAGPVWGPGRPGERTPIDPDAAKNPFGPLGVFMGMGDGDLVRRLVLMFGILVVFSLMIWSHFSEKPQQIVAGDTAALGSDIAPETSDRARPFQGLLDEAKDGLALEDLEASQPFRTLLWNLRILTVAEISSHSTEVAAAELLRKPNTHRGHFIRASGVLLAPLTPRRLPKNEAGHEYAWRGMLMDTWSSDSSNVYAFDMLEKPEQEFARQDGVIIEGVFLQTLSYESRDGKKRSVPYLMVKSVKPLVGERTSGLSSTMTLLIIAAFGVLSLPFIGILISNLLKRRHETELLAALEKARSRRPLGRKPAAEAPPAAAATPAAPAADAPAAPAQPEAPPSSGAGAPPTEPPAPPTPPAAS